MIQINTSLQKRLIVDVMFKITNNWITYDDNLETNNLNNYLSIDTHQ